MKNNKLVLNFNSPNLKFNVNNIGEYDFDAIYKNINNFNVFIDSSVLTASFEKIYKTAMFQACLGEGDTATVENLLEVYNTIGSMGLLDEKLPILDKNEFIRQLRLRGFKFKTVIVRNFDGSKSRITRIYKNRNIDFYE